MLEHRIVFKCIYNLTIDTLLHKKLTNLADTTVGDVPSTFSAIFTNKLLDSLDLGDRTSFKFWCTFAPPWTRIGLLTACSEIQ